MAGFIYLDRLETICTVAKTGSFVMRHSVVSACLPSPSLRNLLTCPVAMTSAEDVGKGKSCFCLWTLWIPHGEPSFLPPTLFSVDFITVYNVCVFP